MKKWMTLFLVLLMMTGMHAAFAEEEMIFSDDASGFVLLSDAVPDAILEIRYYSTYNFIGDRIDGYEEPIALLTREAAAALKEVSDDLIDILHNRRKITADTSIRLGRFFGVSDRFFLDMQNDIEVRELIVKLDGDITTIKPYAAVAM